MDTGTREAGLEVAGLTARWPCQGNRHGGQRSLERRAPCGAALTLQGLPGACGDPTWSLSLHLHPPHLLTRPHCRPPLQEGACLGKQRRGREGSTSMDHPHWSQVPGGEESEQCGTQAEMDGQNGSSWDNNSKNKEIVKT